MARVTVSGNSDCTAGVNAGNLTTLQLDYDEEKKVFVTTVGDGSNAQQVQVRCIKFSRGQLIVDFPSGWTIDTQGFGTARGTTAVYPDSGHGTTKAKKPGEPDIDIVIDSDGS